MKRIITTIFATLAIICTAIPAHTTEKSVGLLGGVSTSEPAPVAGVYFGWGVIPHLRITPSVVYQFEQHGTDAVMINLDVQSPWTLTGTRFRVYPLAGITVSRWNAARHHDDAQSEKIRYDRLGFNVGGGVEWKPSALMGLKIFAEGKFAYAYRFNTGVISVGLGYVF